LRKTDSNAEKLATALRRLQKIPALNIAGNIKMLKKHPQYAIDKVDAMLGLVSIGGEVNEAVRSLFNQHPDKVREHVQVLLLLATRKVDRRRSDFIINELRRSPEKTTVILREVEKLFVHSDLLRTPSNFGQRSVCGLGDVSFVIGCRGLMKWQKRQRLFEYGKMTPGVGLVPQTSLFYPLLDQFMPEEKVCSICHDRQEFFALTNCGRVFKWSYTRVQHPLFQIVSEESISPPELLTGFQPELQDDEYIMQIVSGQLGSLFLTNLGNIYLRDRQSYNPVKCEEIQSILKQDDYFVSIATHSNDLFAVTNDGDVFYIPGEKLSHIRLLKATDFKIVCSDLRPKEKFIQATIGYKFAFLLTNQGRLFYSLTERIRNLWPRFKLCNVLHSRLDSHENIVQLDHVKNGALFLTSKGGCYGCKWTNLRRGGLSFYEIPFKLPGKETIASVVADYTNNAIITSAGRVFVHSVDLKTRDEVFLKNRRDCKHVFEEIKGVVCLYNGAANDYVDIDTTKEERIRFLMDKCLQDGSSAVRVQATDSVVHVSKGLLYRT
jgi:alpha-tubulin suppressor-like RCC1 family protein